MIMKRKELFPLEEQVKEILDKVRPALQADGGDVELVDVDETTGIVKVKLTGSCFGCPFATLTLKNGIEAALKEAIPEVKEVIDISQ